jgi:hypothetical protein
MDVGARFIANTKAAIAVYPSMCPLDDPSNFAESTTVALTKEDSCFSNKREFIRQRHVAALPPADTLAVPGFCVNVLSSTATSAMPGGRIR